MKGILFVICKETVKKDSSKDFVDESVETNKQRRWKKEKIDEIEKKEIFHPKTSRFHETQETQIFITFSASCQLAVSFT